MDLPLVISSTIDKEGKKQQNYYPIEVLQVCDNQRVKTNQLTPTMTQLAIKVNFLLARQTFPLINCKISYKILFIFLNYETFFVFYRCVEIMP